MDDADVDGREAGAPVNLDSVDGRAAFSIPSNRWGTLGRRLRACACVAIVA